ncbi:MAG TPA: ADP-heptose synthase [Verrucomicrobiales bacterium]|nr:ADP-heptose synthase [Verrucomicrobiales bacterium]
MNFHDKILTQSSLTEWRAAQRAAGRTVAATNGCFDILHAGHVEYLQAARNEADALLVGLNSDRSIGELKGPERPIHTEADRATVLAALASVDAVVVFDELRATNFLKLAEPDVYVKGGDYTVDELPTEERAVVDALGGRIVVLAHVPGKSTSDIAARIGAG